jgi:hypothetical protein
MVPSTALLAALLAATSAAPFRPDARDLFSGCSAERNGPNGRFYGCKGWNASLTGLPAFKYSQEQALQIVRTAARSAIPGNVREERIERTLGDANRVVLRFYPLDAATRRAVAFAEMTVLPTRNAARMATCLVANDEAAQRERCVKILEYFATVGAPDGVDVDAPAPIGEPRIAGRPLAVPRGCKIANANEDTGRIQCDSAMLSWTTMPREQIPSVGRWLDETVPTFGSFIGKGFTDERVSCRLEGNETHCARLTKQVPRGTMRVWIGTAVLDRWAVMVSCAFLDDGAGAPAVCKEAIAVP